MKRVTITPDNTPIGVKVWCHNCENKNRDELFTIEGFRRFGGYTRLCWSCLEDLGINPTMILPEGWPSDFPRPGIQNPPASPPDDQPKGKFDGTYPVPEGRTAGYIGPPPPGSGSPV